jgi:hypothetical protein
VVESRNAAVPRNDELVDSDSSAEMMVKIAKDHQNRALENIKVSLNAVLDNAKDFVEPGVGRETASKDTGRSSESNFLTVLEEAATEFRAEVVELMTANVISTLGYTRGWPARQRWRNLSSYRARKRENNVS